MLLFGSEQEILQQLRSRQLASASQIYVVGDVGNDVYHLLLVVELQAFLREVAELHGVANHDASFVYGFLAQQHLDECRLSRTVGSHNTHFLKT